MRLSNPACPESVKPLLHSFVPSLDPPTGPAAFPAWQASVSEPGPSHAPLLAPNDRGGVVRGSSAACGGNAMGRIPPPSPRCGYVGN